jgi:hypothetical protein
VARAVHRVLGMTDIRMKRRRIVTGVPTGSVAWGDDGRSLYIAAKHRILRLRTLTSGVQP